MATGQVLFQRFFYTKSFVKHSMEVRAPVFLAYRNAWRANLGLLSCRAARRAAAGVGKPLCCQRCPPGGLFSGRTSSLLLTPLLKLLDAVGMEQTSTCANACVSACVNGLRSPGLQNRRGSTTHPGRHERVSPPPTPEREEVSFHQIWFKCFRVFMLKLHCRL